MLQGQSLFWLGGGCGAGKTTVATALARRLDLRLYPVDAYGYEHAARAAIGALPSVTGMGGSHAGGPVGAAAGTTA